MPQKLNLSGAEVTPVLRAMQNLQMTEGKEVRLSDFLNALAESIQVGDLLLVAMSPAADDDATEKLAREMLCERLASASAHSRSISSLSQLIEMVKTALADAAEELQMPLVRR